MHLVAVEHGVLGATGVVGGTIPLALGTALACQGRGQDQVVAVFFGDGAAGTGSFHESLNIASLWRLPVILVCENNGYAEFTPMSAHTVVDRVAAHAEPYGIPSQVIDGNDPLAVFDATSEAVTRARSGGGPTIVECLTYRLQGHYLGDPESYRKAEEVAAWREKDPIGRFSDALVAQGVLKESEVQALAQEARERVEAAVRFARESPWPDPSTVADQVFA